MRYSQLNTDLKTLMGRFAQDVLDYLEATGRAQNGRTYFGAKAANNPHLVQRLEAGNLPSLEVMLRVWEYMENNPPSGGVSAPTQKTNSDAA